MSLELLKERFGHSGVPKEVDNTEISQDHKRSNDSHRQSGRDQDGDYGGGDHTYPASKACFEKPSHKACKHKRPQEIRGQVHRK